MGPSPAAVTPGSTARPRPCRCTWSVPCPAGAHGPSHALQMHMVRPMPCRCTWSVPCPAGAHGPFQGTPIVTRQTEPLQGQLPPFPMRMRMRKLRLPKGPSNHSSQPPHFLNNHSCRSTECTVSGSATGNRQHNKTTWSTHHPGSTPAAGSMRQTTPRLREAVTLSQSKAFSALACCSRSAS
jgi:hypothetical protein